MFNCWLTNRYTTLTAVAVELNCENQWSRERSRKSTTEGNFSENFPTTEKKISFFRFFIIIFGESFAQFVVVSSGTVHWFFSQQLAQYVGTLFTHIEQHEHERYESIFIVRRFLYCENFKNWLYDDRLSEMETANNNKSRNYDRKLKVLSLNHIVMIWLNQVWMIHHQQSLRFCGNSIFN